jgi:hypothetical protein
MGVFREKERERERQKERERGIKRQMRDGGKM